MKILVMIVLVVAGAALMVIFEPALELAIRGTEVKGILADTVRGAIGGALGGLLWQLVFRRP